MDPENQCYMLTHDYPNKKNILSTDCLYSSVMNNLKGECTDGYSHLHTRIVKILIRSSKQRKR